MDVLDAEQLVNNALLELAVLSEGVEAYVSTDPNVVLMRAVLNSLGKDLARKFPWSHLQKTHTFNTSSGTETYDLPIDFDRFTRATQWNRATDWPLMGPASGQDWQYFKATNFLTGTTFWFRKVGNKIALHPVPTSTQQIAFEYQSNRWVISGVESVTEPDDVKVTGAQNSVWFDAHLVHLGLMARWLVRKGMDATAALAEFQAALAQATGADGPDASLMLDGPRCGPPPGSSLPYTNWGV